MPAVTIKSLHTFYLNGHVPMKPSSQRSCHPLLFQRTRRILVLQQQEGGYELPLNLSCASCGVDSCYLPRGGGHLKPSLWQTILQYCFPAVANLFIWEVSGICTATSIYICFLAMTFFSVIFVFIINITGFKHVRINCGRKANCSYRGWGACHCSEVPKPTCRLTKLLFLSQGKGTSVFEGRPFLFLAEDNLWEGRKEAPKPLSCSRELNHWSWEKSGLWGTPFKPLEQLLLWSKEPFVLNNNILISCLSSSQRKPLLPFFFPLWRVGCTELVVLPCGFQPKTSLCRSRNICRAQDSA